MKYTYRLKEMPDDTGKIKIFDFLDLKDNDGFIVFLAGEMKLLGAYEKKEDYLILKKKLSGKLSDYYSCFSMIKDVNERTYKMFAKPVRQIEDTDFECIIKASFVK